MERLLCLVLVLLDISTSAAQTVEMSGSGDSNVSALLVPLNDSTTIAELTNSLSSSSSLTITPQISVSLTPLSSTPVPSSLPSMSQPINIIVSINPQPSSSISQSSSVTVSSTPVLLPSMSQPISIIVSSAPQPSSSISQSSSVTVSSTPVLLLSMSQTSVIVSSTPLVTLRSSRVMQTSSGIESILPTTTIQVAFPSRTARVSPLLTKATTLSSTPTAMPTTVSSDGSIALVAGASAGAVVVFLTVLMVIIICCCVLIRRHKKSKYTLETAWEGGFVKTDTFPLQVPSNNNNISIENPGAVTTFGIRFPETPKPKDGEDLPPLVILNPVQKYSSNTLPSKSKLRATTSVVSIDSSTGLKPSRSIGDINFSEAATPSTFQIQPQKTTEPESDKQTKEPSPEQNPAKEQSIGEKHNRNGTDTNPRESTGYVYMQPRQLATVEQQVQQENKTESIYQIPSGIPVQDKTNNSTSLQADAVYDVPPLTNSYAQPQGSPIISKSSEVPSHYDVPKSILAAYREKATGKSVEDRQTSDANSSSVYDIPRTLVLANASVTQEIVYDIPEGQNEAIMLSKVAVNDDDDTHKQKTSLQMQSSVSEDEHEYCMPPDETLQLMKELAAKKQKEKSNSPVVKPRVRQKPKINSKQNDFTPPASAASNGTHPNSNGSHDNTKKYNSNLDHEYDTPPQRESDTPNEEQLPTNKPLTKPKVKPRAFKQPVGMPKDLMQELYSKQNANGSKTATPETEQSVKKAEKPPVKEKPKPPLLKPRRESD